MSKILLAGGAGYIGSHVCVSLLEAKHELVIVDNFSNSCPAALDRLFEITGERIPFVKADIRDEQAMDSLFSQYDFDAVIHLAGLKAVGESVAIPLKYYDNNIGGTIVLLEAMKKHNVKRMVFSSSATVYGIPEYLPLDEQHPLSCTNPYGWTKLMIEQILRDVCTADEDFSAVLLRYFNPVGAHESGLIGEDPSGIPNNLTPYIAQVAVGKLPELPVTGDDYDTPDGTGVRDYLHVMDLAEGHVAAVEYAIKHRGADAVNLGTGNGTSVLEMVAAMSRASGKEIPYAIKPRRPGDIASSYTSCDKAKNVLGWTAKKTLDDMCADLWRWQSNNPNGYNND